MKTPNRNTRGQFRVKRGDTRMGTVEKQYSVNFSVRSDMKLSTYLKNSGLPSLSKAVKQADSQLRKP